MSEADDELTEDVSDDAYAPTDEPKSSRSWLALLKKADKAGFADYQDRCDNIDKQYANIDRLAATTREREMQMFWANIQVLGPSIYSRPPVPVVVPRFKDRTPLPRTASELLERATIVTFDMEDIDQIMRQLRDDLTASARGVAWLRYEAKSKDNNFVERVCIEHLDRRDFKHDPARYWQDTDWVGRCAWLTRKDARKRFRKSSGDAYQSAEYAVRKDDDGSDDGKLKAAFWEIWCKSLNKVVWVSEGVDVCLDEGEPHLTLEGFWPCPRPVYGTTQRRSLIPVPDYLFYKDQIEEINEMTGRLSALAEALRLKGFYPAGAGEVSDAIEAAIKNQSDSAILVPVSNWAMMGQGAKDMILWLPLDMVATTITQLIALRKQLIEDVYQITGLSDIMRGSTVASETLGAQQLKSQYGSIRIRDRQDELVRIAKDITRMSAEIMAENFQQKTLVDMTQLKLPTSAEISKQVKDLTAKGKAMEAELHQAQQDPEVLQMAQQAPDKAKAAIQQAQQQLDGISAQIAKLEQTVTIDKVMDFLRDEKLRPFVLDIETDSTIAPDENAQKQRATEFITAVGGFMGQAMEAVQKNQAAAPLAADMLKYVASQFRAGRELEGTIDEFADQMKQVAGQPKPPDPTHLTAQAQAQALAQKTQLEAQAHQADMAAKQADAQIKQQDAQVKQQAAQADFDLKQQEAQARVEMERQRTDADLQAKQAEQERKSRADFEKAQSDAAASEQALKIGALNIVLLKTKIAQAEQQIEAEMQQAEMEANAELTGEGVPANDQIQVEPKAKPDPVGELKAMIAELSKIMAAPQVVVRDANNRVVGSRRVVE